MRSRLATALFLATLAVIGGCAGTVSDSRTAVQEVLAAEDEYVYAEIGRDEAALRRLVDDRFVRVLGNGSTHGKEEFVQSVLKSRTGQ